MAYLGFHFFALFIYSKPVASEKRRLDFYSQAYMYPYFHQNWNLFVPVPDRNYKLLCKYENNGLQKLDLFSEVRTIHQADRLKGYGPILIALANSIHYFEKAATQQPINGPIQNDLSFEIIEHIAKNYLEYTRKIEIQKLKLILVVQQTNDSKQKIYYN